MAIYTRDKEGVLSPLNIRAIKGKDGKNGIDGVTPNITIGEVTTLEAGEEATVNISGTKENPVLNFGIPKGEDGTNGNINIDDENVSKNTTWSSDKTDKEVKKSNEGIKELETKNEEQDKRIKEIEDTGKLQDFYINGLFNENTDKRISVEEEGNEIKLEGSKKGFVEIDKIVGNTLVNRVNEPMRNLTLNGDIDEEGSFVTTNEGTQHGLVDVVCEGNTMVNLIKMNGVYKRVDGGANINNHVPITYGLKGNTLYTRIIHVSKVKLGTNESIRMYDSIHDVDDTYRQYPWGMIQNTGYYVNKFTTSDLGTKNEYTFNPDVQAFNGSSGAEIEIDKFILLEGDYTDKPIPAEYFEGMKSVGEQEDGNHKIEILSNNKNLVSVNDFNIPIGNNIAQIDYVNGLYKVNQKGNVHFRSKILNLKQNTDYTVSYVAKTKDSGTIRVRSQGVIFTSGGNSKAPLTFNTGNKKDITIEIYHRENAEISTYENIMLSKYNGGDYILQKQNKKEILLQEPLRGLPNGVKDRYVKIDGKWFIERNCGVRTIDSVVANAGIIETNVLGKFLNIDNSNYLHNNTQSIADKVVCDEIHANHLPSVPAISTWLSHSHQWRLFHPSFTTKKEYVDWLTNNPIEVIYIRATPIYEPLDITPELVCYDEVTHISNDSLIPCNMVVKNTGFSCMPLLKDGTYTTFHNGGEGITSKVDTTNNIVRFSGKGKNISDVMVLDGKVSKTYGKIEGMKSTFEDKLVTQEMVDNGLEKAENLGKYKVDITVRSKNLFNKNKKFTLGKYYMEDGCIGGNGVFGDTNKNFIDETYYIINSPTLSWFGIGGEVTHPLGVSFYDSSKNFINRYERTHITNYEVPVNAKYYRIKGDYGRLNYLILNEGNTISQYEPYYEYTTSVYLNNLLLKGDEIVVKEDGLYHYHKMGKDVLDGNEEWWGIGSEGDTINGLTMYKPATKVKSDTLCLSDRLKSLKVHTGHTDFVRIGGGTIIVNLLRTKLSTQDEKGFRKWLYDNPTTVIYELAEPYYEKISDNNLLLNIPNAATLHIDTIMPCQNIKANYTGKIPSLYGMENTISTIDEYSISMVASNFDMDYRLLEIEWALENAGITGIDIMNMLNIDGMKSINLTRYEQAKIMITSGVYNKNTLTRQLNRYLEKNIITKEEFDELIELMK